MVFHSPVDELLELLFLTQPLGVPCVRRQINSESNQLLSNYRLRTVNNKLINKRYTLCIRESGLRLIFETQMVKQLQNKSAVARGL